MSGSGCFCPISRSGSLAHRCLSVARSPALPAGCGSQFVVRTLKASRVIVRGSTITVAKPRHDLRPENRCAAACARCAARRVRRSHPNTPAGRSESRVRSVPSVSSKTRVTGRRAMPSAPNAWRTRRHTGRPRAEMAHLRTIPAAVPALGVLALAFWPLPSRRWQWRAARPAARAEQSPASPPSTPTPSTPPPSTQAPLGSGCR